MEGKKGGEQRFFPIASGVELEFRWIPAGSFEMGSPPCEPGRHHSEELRTIRIKKGYWIAAHETTTLVWQKVTGMPPRLKSTAIKKPKAQITYFDCRDFLKRLKSPAPGWELELPSEAEWEYACRAGSKAPFPGPPAQFGWLAMNSGGRRNPVGLKTPNAWSVHDMHGNVAEWCRDTVGPTGSEIAIRGDSWDSDLNARAAARNSDTPFLRINRVGFRLVLVRKSSISQSLEKPSRQQK